MFKKQNINILDIMTVLGVIFSLLLLASSPTKAKSRCSGYDNADCLLTKFLAQNPIARGKPFKKPSRKKKRLSKKIPRKSVSFRLVTLPIQRPHKPRSNYQLTTLKSNITLEKNSTKPVSKMARPVLAPSDSVAPQLTKQQIEKTALAEKKLFNAVPKVASIVIRSHVQAS